MVVPAADAFLRHVRFGGDGSELTTRAYAGGIVLYLRWCARSGRDWRSAATDFGLFIVWLRHAGAAVSGLEPVPGAQLLTGPGARPARSARRINAVLSAVRGFLAHAVSAGDASTAVLPLLYDLADDRDLPVVLLMARAGLRRGELCGLRRNDVHVLLDSRVLGCDVERAHLHVMRRDNPNGAWAKSRRQRTVPLDFLTVQALDGYADERTEVTE